MTTYPWAPGFVEGDRPMVVTSRFRYEDSYTLERYHATGGYDGLRSVLAMSPADGHNAVKTATLLGRGGAGFPAGVKWGLTPPGGQKPHLVPAGKPAPPRPSRLAAFTSSTTSDGALARARRRPSYPPVAR